jgi:hypothetical protein
MSAHKKESTLARICIALHRYISNQNTHFQYGYMIQQFQAMDNKIEGYVFPIYWWTLHVEYWLQI